MLWWECAMIITAMIISDNEFEDCTEWIFIKIKNADNVEDDDNGSDVDEDRDDAWYDDDDDVEDDDVDNDDVGDGDDDR